MPGEGERERRKGENPLAWIEAMRESLDVFASDVGLVRGCCELRLPWEQPTEGRCSVVYLPKDGRKVLASMGEIDRLVVTCMDGDVAWRVHMSLGEGHQLGSLSMAGGVIQPEGERSQAQRILARSLARLKQGGYLPQLTEVWVGGHNNVCKGIDHFLGKSLLEAIGFGLYPVLPRSDEESAVVNALVTSGARNWKVLEEGGIEVIPFYYDTARQPGEQEARPSQILIRSWYRGLGLSIEDIRGRSRMFRELLDKIAAWSDFD